MQTLAHLGAMIDFSGNYFELFGLTPRFALDVEALDRAYRALQSEAHPDRFASGTDAERRVALQSSARINEAYRALCDPVERATHLLSLRGVDARGEGDSSLDMQFLERQLERREEASDAAAAEDEAALGAILAGVREEMREREAALARLFEGSFDPGRARNEVRELRFLAKVAQDIDAMIAAVED